MKSAYKQLVLDLFPSSIVAVSPGGSTTATFSVIISSLFSAGTSVSISATSSVGTPGMSVLSVLSLVRTPTPPVLISVFPPSLPGSCPTRTRENCRSVQSSELLVDFPQSFFHQVGIVCKSWSFTVERRQKVFPCRVRRMWRVMLCDEL